MTATTRRPDTALCGTDAGHQRHRRRRERPCEPCAQAHRDRSAYYALARGRATLALARLPELADQYARLVDEQNGHPRRCDRARRELARLHPRTLQRLLTDEFARLAIEETR